MCGYNYEPIFDHFSRLKWSYWQLYLCWERCQTIFTSSKTTRPMLSWTDPGRNTSRSTWSQIIQSILGLIDILLMIFYFMNLRLTCPQLINLQCSKNVNLISTFIFITSLLRFFNSPEITVLPLFTCLYMLPIFCNLRMVRSFRLWLIRTLRNCASIRKLKIQISIGETF